QRFELVQRRRRELELLRVERGRPDAEDYVTVALRGELQEGPGDLVGAVLHRVNPEAPDRRGRQVCVEVDRDAPVRREVLSYLPEYGNRREVVHVLAGPLLVVEDDAKAAYKLFELAAAVLIGALHLGGHLP